MRKKEKRTNRFMRAFVMEDFEGVRKCAAEEHKSVSAFIRDVLRAYLQFKKEAKK